MQVVLEGDAEQLGRLLALHRFFECYGNIGDLPDTVFVAETMGCVLYDIVEWLPNATDDLHDNLLWEFSETVHGRLVDYLLQFSRYADGYGIRYNGDDEVEWIKDIEEWKAYFLNEWDTFAQRQEVWGRVTGVITRAVYLIDYILRYDKELRVWNSLCSKQLNYNATAFLVGDQLPKFDEWCLAVRNKQISRSNLEEIGIAPAHVPKLREWITNDLDAK